jgi:alanine dehydrogenase
MLLGGVPGVMPAKVVVIGGGIVGSNAARMAAGLGAKVVILDVSLNRLRYLADVMPANVTTLYSNRYNILEQISDADLVVGAVLLPGAKAPNLVRREDLKSMMDGSVIVDVAVDQGGCVETIKPTTHENPIYVVDGVVHYAVANMPGAVSRTSTLALTNATFPYAVTLANKGWKAACRDDRALALGLNVVRGKLGRRLVPTGLAIALPPGMEAQIRPRSGLALKRGVSIINTPCTIDSDYRGEIRIPLINLDTEPQLIEHGERIAQLLVAPVVRIEWQPASSLPPSERGEGGFGSTGR